MIASRPVATLYQGKLFLGLVVPPEIDAHVQVTPREFDKDRPSRGRLSQDQRQVGYSECHLLCQAAPIVRWDLSALERETSSTVHWEDK